MCFQVCKYTWYCLLPTHLWYLRMSVLLNFLLLLVRHGSAGSLTGSRLHTCFEVGVVVWELRETLGCKACLVAMPQGWDWTPARIWVWSASSAEVLANLCPCSDCCEDFLPSPHALLTVKPTSLPFSTLPPSPSWWTENMSQNQFLSL